MKIKITKAKFKHILAEEVKNAFLIREIEEILLAEKLNPAARSLIFILHPDRIASAKPGAIAKALKQAAMLLKSGSLDARSASVLKNVLSAAKAARVAAPAAAGAALAVRNASLAKSTGAAGSKISKGVKALQLASPKIAQQGAKTTALALRTANTALAKPAASRALAIAAKAGPVAAKTAAKGLLRAVLGPIGLAWMIIDLLAMGSEYLPASSWWRGGVSKGETDRVSAEYSGLAASNWLRWPLEAQCAFCKKNGRKPKLSNGKLAPGPSCADMLANKGLCPDAPQPPTPKRGSLCSRNARLWKSMPDLGPNRKAATKTLQDYLKAAGYSKQMPRTFSDGKADGSCGPETLGAIKAFQRDNGLKVDGLYGNKSHAAMMAFSAKKGKAEPAELGLASDRNPAGPSNRFGVQGPGGERLRGTTGGFSKHANATRESIKKELKKILKEELLK